MNVYFLCCLNSVKEIFFFLTICARNAYLGSKLEYELLCQKKKKKMSNFLPSFKQLQKNGDCDGWRESSNTPKCDSYQFLGNKVPSRKLRNSIKLRNLVIFVDLCL